MWDESFGNLNDPDVLVVDLTTMTEQVLERIGVDKMAHARESITDKLFNGGTIVIVTQPHLSAERPDSRSYSNYTILPVTVKTKVVPEGTRIKVESDHKFKAYIEVVKKFKFQIDKCTLNANTEHLSTPLSNIRLNEMPGRTITDYSGNRLGFVLQLVGDNHAGQVKRVLETGRLVFLPPPPPESVDDGIGEILSAYGKVPVCGEAPPPWAEKVSFSKADQMQDEIAKLEASAGEIQSQISDLHSRRDEILDHRRLLYAKGIELEEAVAAAFKALGFAEAKQMGGADQADCVINMDTSEYLHGLVEVKGADGWTGERDIVQCVKWVEKMHGVDGKWSKPIFVPNQCRKKEYDMSWEDRLQFEPNELDYAKTRNVCIVPSCVLFEATRKAVDGEAPDRVEIAARIASTRGVLERVF